ncbi:GNAT family N-acetyltransferase, partial [Staphylococcus aureus]|uniref:GNAT family N-acetyltransferase n=1 Tax=Staphylococcus aureus TaxID=1280 RepID=UPI0021092B85
AEKIAQEHNKHKIWLGVWEHNPRAQAFYKRHGFKVVGEHHFPLNISLVSPNATAKNSYIEQLTQLR